MAISVFDSLLLRDMFGTPAMRAIFDERAFIARCIDVETALARAEAKVGVIPADAAATITASAKPDAMDFEALRAETEIVGYPILPLVKQLAAQCGEAGAAFLLRGLHVDVARMKRNLDLTGGLIVAEAVMMGLAPEIGRQQAHDVVYDACREAIERGTTLYDALLKHRDIVDRLGEERLRALTDPANYLGGAAAMARDAASRVTPA